MLGNGVAAVQSAQDEDDIVETSFDEPHHRERRVLADARPRDTVHKSELEPGQFAQLLQTHQLVRTTHASDAATRQRLGQDQPVSAIAGCAASSASIPGRVRMSISLGPDRSDAGHQHHLSAGLSHHLFRPQPLVIIGRWHRPVRNRCPGSGATCGRSEAVTVTLGRAAGKGPPWVSLG